MGQRVPLNGEHELRPIYQATKEFEKIAGYLPAHKARDEVISQTAPRLTLPYITPFILGYNPRQRRPGWALLRRKWSIERHAALRWRFGVGKAKSEPFR